MKLIQQHVVGLLCPAAPQIKQTGILNFGKSSAILCLIADLAYPNSLKIDILIVCNFKYSVN